MDLANNHRKLIEEIIRANVRFYGNEDLLEAFCSDVYKKSYLLLDSVSNVDNLKTYLEKVVDTSISNILRQNDRDTTPKTRPDRSRMQIELMEDLPKAPKETSTFDIDLPPEPPRRKFKKTQRPESLKDDRLISIKDESPNLKGLSKDLFAGIDDPKGDFPEPALKETVINKILSIVFDLHTQYPEKSYFQIFYARHACFKKQATIANELKLTQGELSKRYYELIRLVKEQL